MLVCLWLRQSFASASTSDHLPRSGVCVLVAVSLAWELRYLSRADSSCPVFDPGLCSDLDHLPDPSSLPPGSWTCHLPGLTSLETHLGFEQASRPVTL